MTKLAWLLAASLGALFLLLAACGGGGDDDKAGGDDDDASPAQLTENDLAQALLIVLEDLPASENWAFSTSAKTDEPNPLDACDTGDDPGLIGKADGEGDFSNDGITEISQDIRIFQTTSQLEDSIDSVKDRADCMKEQIENGALDTEDALFSDFHIDDLEFREFGDVTHAYRISMLATQAVPTPGTDPETAQFYIDQVFVGVDTVGTRIQGTSIFDPFPADKLESFISLAETKIRDILANGTPTGQAEPTMSGEPGDTRTPIVTSEEVTPSAGATEPAAGNNSSFDNPVPFGSSGVLAGAVQVSVVNVNPDAEDIVLAENQFNDPAPAGKRMVLVRLEFTNVGDGPYDIYFDPGFNMVGDKGIAYNEFDDDCGVIPDEVDGEIFPGGTKQGNICLQVDADDSNIRVFLDDFDENFNEDRLFLALN